MPYYRWIDKNTNQDIEVKRKMADIDIPPDKDECVEHGIEVEDYATADWERQVDAPSFIGPKGKGNW